MKVSQLIKLLQKEDPNREVIFASDSEGNSYSLFTNGSLHACAYRRDSYGEIELGLEKMTPALRRRGATDDEVLENGKPALVFYP